MCPALSNPANGQVMVNNYTVDGVATYTCSNGYNVTGAEMRVCVQKGENGRWIQQSPTCERKLTVLTIVLTMITLSLSY